MSTGGVRPKWRLAGIVNTMLYLGPWKVTLVCHLAGFRIIRHYYHRNMNATISDVHIEIQFLDNDFWILNKHFLNIMFVMSEVL